MRCPKCGNEVNQDEAFCGQCGTPTRPPIQQTEMVQAPHSGLLQTYNQINPSIPGTPGAYHTSPMHSTSANSSFMPPVNSGSQAPANQTPIIMPSGPGQQNGFYQDATEAMSSLPNNVPQGYPSNYPQQGYTGTPLQSGYPGTGQFGPTTQAQPFNTGNYTQQGHPPLPQNPSAQMYTGFPAQPGLTPPPAKQPHNAILIIAIVLLVVALLVVTAFGTLYFLKGESNPKPSISPTPVATSAPSPTPSPNPSPTATATPSPTPSPNPTPAPDANFVWCDAACTNNGFTVEYPIGWNQGQTSDKTGVQFLNPSQQDQYAAVKMPQNPGGANASDLVDTELQNISKTQSGYTPPTSKLVTTIGGETWTYAVAYFQLNGIKERIAVYATIHAKKGYVIELQAADDQFEAINTQYFSKMIARFQFLPSTS